MTDITPITVALYGFGKERKPIMESAFETADKWTIPWKVISSIEDARVVIVELAPESDDNKEIEKLEQNLPKAEIVALSTIKPPYAKWHLTWQPSGKVAIIEFSKLVLKISHSLKKKLSEVPKRQIDGIDLAKPSSVTAVETSSSFEKEDFDQESSDFLPFFNTLDSLLESKPNEKRKRFNEPS